MSLESGFCPAEPPEVGIKAAPLGSPAVGLELGASRPFPIQCWERGLRYVFHE